MDVILSLAMVVVSAVACLTQSMPGLKIVAPPNRLSYLTYRYRLRFFVVAVLLALWLASRWVGAGMSGWFAPAAIVFSALIWATLVGAPAALFHPFHGQGKILPAVEAGMVADGDTVIGVVVRGEARAYPERMLMPQHTIPDEVGAEPITVTWCPLCHSGMVFEGAVHGVRIKPQVIGGGNNNVLIYDGASKNMFQQITGEILEGPDKGQHLTAIPSMITTWATWKQEHPNTTVWWRSSGTLLESVTRTLTLWAPTTIVAKQKPFYVMNRPPDRRLGYTELVSGVTVGNRRRVYPSTSLAHHPVVNDTVSDVPVTVFSKANGRIVRFFRRQLDEHTLTFQDAAGPADAVIARDEQTNSGWTLDGIATDGPLEGSQLTPLPGITRVFWFAYAHFSPGAEIWTAGQPAAEREATMAAAMDAPGPRRASG